VPAIATTKVVPVVANVVVPRLIVPAKSRPWLKPAATPLFYPTRYFAPGLTDTPADMFAAAMIWLRSNTQLVAAFGEVLGTPATTKFFDGVAQGSPNLPYAVFEEDTAFKRDQSDGSYIEDGSFKIRVVAGKLQQARLLAEQLVAVLDDAPLTFVGGRLMKIRSWNAYFDDDDELGIGTPVEYERVVIYRYFACKSRH
jgi:hypothetical protein